MNAVNLGLVDQATAAVAGVKAFRWRGHTLAGMAAFSAG
jgi:hypothetical protein